MQRRHALLCLFAAAAIATQTGCSRSSSSSSPPPAISAADIPEMTVDQVQARVAAHDGKTFVFDDNPRDRYDRGHVPGARWVESGDVSAAVLPPDKEATLVFYCANEA